MSTFPRQGNCIDSEEITFGTIDARLNTTFKWALLRRAGIHLLEVCYQQFKALYRLSQYPI